MPAAEPREDLLGGLPRDAPVTAAAYGLGMTTPADESGVPALLNGWREARLDLLLAEELAVSPRFADHLTRRALDAAGHRAPDGIPERVDVAFNVWQQVDDGNAGGTTST